MSVCVEEGVASVVLVGHSFGSAVAYTFAKMYARFTKALILVEPRLTYGCIEYQDRPYQRSQLRQRAMTMASPGAAKRFREGVDSGLTLVSPRLRTEIRAKRLGTPKHVRIASVTSVSSVWRQFRPRMPKIPVLAILGHCDGAEDQDQVLNRIAHEPTILTWADCGHYPMLEKPRRFAREVNGFLEELPSSR